MSTQPLSEIVLLKQEDVQKVEQEAQQLIRKVATTDTLSLDDLMDEIGNMGQRTMEKAGQSLSMLERPVNELMSGKRSEVTNNILKLRDEVDALNKSKQVGFFNKLLKKTPMKNFVNKYQSVNTNVAAIVQSLRNGKDNLQENIVYMKNLKRTAIQEVYNVQARIALGNKLKELFEVEITKPENAHRKTHLERGLRKVVTRIQSFTEMILLYQQAIAGTDIINDNNDKLIDAVDSTIHKTQHLITVSAMISMALQDQLNTIDAVNSTNRTLETMFAENSRLLKETTQKTNDLLGKPAMQMDVINQAIGDLFTAMDLYEQSNRSIIQTASEHTEKMTAINKQLSQRLGLTGTQASQASLQGQQQSQPLSSFLE